MTAPLSLGQPGFWQALAQDVVNPQAIALAQQDAQTQPQSASLAQVGAFQWILAWGVLIGLLWLANKSKTGHVVIFYLLVMLLVFDVLTQYSFFAAALKPFALLVPKGKTNG